MYIYTQIWMGKKSSWMGKIRNPDIPHRNTLGQAHGRVSKAERERERERATTTQTRH